MIQSTELSTALNTAVEKGVTEKVINPLEDIISSVVDCPSEYIEALKIKNIDLFKVFTGPTPLTQFINTTMYNDAVAESVLGVNTNRILDALKDGTIYLNVNPESVEVVINVPYSPLNSRYLRGLRGHVEEVDDILKSIHTIASSVDGNSYNTLVEMVPNIISLVYVVNTLNRRISRCNSIWMRLPNFQ